MLSRVPITSEMVQVPSLIKSWALPSHTSVPWDRPEICSRSEKVLGWDVHRASAAQSWCPSPAGTRVPVLQSMSSSVTPSAAGDVNRLYDLPVAHWMTSITVNAGAYPPGAYRRWAHRVPAYPACRMVSWREWKSKWVVTMSRIRVIRRMLHRSEVVDLVVIGHNNHAARMLAGGALDTGTAQGQALFFIAVHMDAPAPHCNGAHSQRLSFPPRWRWFPP